jgi:endonuclease YncB( thermonuclease family)
VPIIRLRGEDIDGDRFSCTGEQVASVLEELIGMPELAESTWYAASLDAFDTAITPCQTDDFAKIENLENVIEHVRAIGQLLDGVFIAIQGVDAPERNTPAPISATRPMANFAKNSTVEVRAYDTSWVAIYTDHSEILDKLRSVFCGELRLEDK